MTTMELNDLDPTLTMPRHWRSKLWHALLLSIIIFVVAFLQAQGILSPIHLGELHTWFNSHITTTIMQAWPF